MLRLLSGEATNINFIVYDLPRPGLESNIWDRSPTHGVEASPVTGVTEQK
jgi:hypothetical protein